MLVVFVLAAMFIFNTKPLPLFSVSPLGVPNTYYPTIPTLSTITINHPYLFFTEGDLPSIRTKYYAFDSFVTQHASNTSRIQAMQFQTIPGYSLEEHREEVRNLWQDVHQQVKNYFN